MRKNLLILLMLLSTFSITAQTVNVSGNVTDTDNEPLPGVTVLEKGTTNGTSTDIDGNYRLSVSSASSELVYSFVGFDSQEIRVGDRKVINVRLQESATTLDDVVVVAFGQQKRSEVVGAVTTIRPEELKTKLL